VFAISPKFIILGYPIADEYGNILSTFKLQLLLIKIFALYSRKLPEYTVLNV
jgi:hypothetical protein